MHSPPIGRARLRFALAAMLALAPAARADDAAELFDEIRKSLPGLPDLAGAAGLTTCGSLCVQKDHAGMTLALFAIGPQGGRSYHALVAPKDGRLDLAAGSPKLGKDMLGDARLTSPFLVLSSGDASADLGSLKLPAAASWGGALELKRGIAVFTGLRLGTTGSLAKLARTIGLGDGEVRINAAVEAGAAGSFFKAGAARAATKTATVVFPRFAPFPFNKIKEAPFGVELSALRFDLVGEGRQIRIDGTADALVNVKKGGKQVKIAVKLNGARDGATGDFALHASGTSAPIDMQDPAGLGFQVSKLTVAGDLAGGKTSKRAGLAVGATVALKGKPTDVVFATSMKGGKLADLSLTIRGTYSLAELPGMEGLGSKLAKAAKDFQLVDPAFGFDPKTKEANVHGTLKWVSRTLSAEAVVLKRRTGMTLLFRPDREVKLIDFVPEKLKAALQKMPGIEMLKLPKSLLAISTAKVAAKRAELPAAAARMVQEALGAADLGLPDGFSMSGKIDASNPPAAMKKLFDLFGIRGDLVLSGSISGLFSGAPGLRLTADLAKVTPPQAKGLKFSNLGIVVAASAARQEAEFGVKATVAVDPRHKIPPIDLLTMVRLERTGPAVVFGGQMKGTWVSPLGFDKTKLTGATLSGGINAHSAVHVAVAGKLDLGGGLVFNLKGLIMDILPAPAPETFALALETTSEVSPLTQFMLMERLVKAAVNGPLANSRKLAKVRPALQHLSRINIMEKLNALPLPLLKFAPIDRKRPVLIYVATPGVSDPLIPAIDGMGVRLRGAASFMNHKLGTIDAALDTQQFSLKASINDFSWKAGGANLFSIKNCKMDALLPMQPGGGSPHFNLTGNVKVLVFNANTSVQMDSKQARFSVKGGMGPLGDVTVALASVGPSLAKASDFALTLKIEQKGLKSMGEHVAKSFKEHAREVRRKVAARLGANKLEEKIERAKANLAAAKKRDKHCGKKPRSANPTVLARMLKEFAACEMSTAAAKKDIIKYEAILRSEQAALASARGAAAAAAAPEEIIARIAEKVKIEVTELGFENARLAGAVKGNPTTLRMKIQFGKKAIDGAATVALKNPAKIDLSALLKKLEKMIRDLGAKAEKELLHQ